MTNEPHNEADDHHPNFPFSRRQMPAPLEDEYPSETEEGLHIRINELAKAIQTLTRHTTSNITYKEQLQHENKELRATVKGLHLLVQKCDKTITRLISGIVEDVEAER